MHAYQAFCKTSIRGEPAFCMYIRTMISEHPHLVARLQMIQLIVGDDLPTQNRCPAKGYGILRRCTILAEMTLDVTPLKLPL